jgi:hypothetical protein
MANINIKIVDPMRNKRIQRVFTADFFNVHIKKIGQEYYVIYSSFL